VKFCFAATHSRPHLKQELYAAEFVLESFFYVKEHQLDYLKSRKLFLLDSGAFSFINTGKRVNWMEFADKYADFVKTHQIKHYFELDIDQIIGVAETRKLRDRLESKVGWQSIPVWHTIRGMDEWTVLCKNYQYISTSLSGFTNTSKWFRSHKHEPLHAMLDISQEYGCKVHGLGFTNIPKLHTHKRLYSVDSTSWLMGGRNGILNIFQQDLGLMKVIAPPKGKRAINYKIIDSHNFKEWLKFQKYAEARLL
jgi:hypothetical protein